MKNAATTKPVVIMGGGGRVGREVVKYLLANTSLNLLLAARHLPTLEGIAPRYRDRVSSTVLDASNNQAMKTVFQDALLVISCIGPSGIVGESVAHACDQAGAPLVDAGGYDPLLATLEQRHAQKSLSSPMIISVGLLPGLSGMFPRYLIDKTSAGRRVAKLDTYCIGRDAWTYNSAWDIIHSLGDFGQARGFPVIKDGRHESVGFFNATRKTHFPEPVGAVTTMLVPAEEMARLACQLNIAEVRAYGSNIGPRAAFVCVFAKLFGFYKTHSKIQRAANWLVKASQRDMKNLDPIYGLTVEITYDDGERVCETILIGNTYQATGVTIGIAARCLLEQADLKPDVYLLHEAIPSERFFQLLSEERLVATTTNTDEALAAL